MTPLALNNLGHQYVLYGAATAICLAVFVTLILSPALSSYGRLWQKAAAGFMALFVLAALVVTGIVIGLVVVVHWPEIHEFIG